VIAQRRILLELMGEFQPPAATQERIRQRVLKRAQPGRAMRRLMQWQERLHKTSARVWLTLAGDDE
jgi:hypothetical protein